MTIRSKVIGAFGVAIAAVLVMALALFLAAPSVGTAVFCGAALTVAIAPCVYVARGFAFRAMRLGGDTGVRLSTSRTAHTDDKSRIGVTGTPPGGGGAPGCVLVGDSDSQGLRDCQRMLESGGFKVMDALEGQAVLVRARVARPDAIVLSAGLSRPDPLECVRRLKADTSTSEIPVLLVWDGNRADAEYEAALAAGVDGLASEPIREIEFLHRVRTMVRQHRGGIELREINKQNAEDKRVIELVFDYSRSLSSALTLGAILAKTVSVAATLTRCRRVTLMLPDERKANLVIASALGVDDATLGVRVPMCGAMAGRVFQSRKPIVMNERGPLKDVRSEFDSSFFEKSPLASAPLRAAAKSIGVLNLADREGDLPFEQKELEYINQICNMAANAIANIRSRKARDGARDSIVDVLGLLAEYRDDNTGRHIDRVTQYSVLLAEELQKSDAFGNQIDERFMRNLPRAVPLHDIGKVGIPDRILLQPRHLTPSEMETMKLHVDIGVSTIHSLRDRVPGADYLRMAEEIAASHHEWFNGKGYPKGLCDQEIPLSARIVALADVYDALTTARAYKPAFSHAEACGMVSDAAGTQFDPVVVDAFRKRQHQFKVLAAELADPLWAAAHVRDPARKQMDESEDQSASVYSLAPI